MVFQNLLVLVLSLLSSLNELKAEEARLFVLAGQSNMVGWGCNLSAVPAYLQPKQQDILLRFSGEKEQEWTTVQPGLGFNQSCIGPELNFGRTVADSLQTGEKIILFKHSWGRTSLFEDWRPPSAGGKVGWLQTSMMGNLTIALESLKKNQGIDGKIEAMLWMQGESDSLVLSQADEYENNLKFLISDVRKDLNKPNLPIIIGMIDDSELWTQGNIIRTAEWNVAKNDKFVGIFDTHGLPTDKIHYYAQGQIILGSLFAHATLSFIN